MLLVPLLLIPIAPALILPPLKLSVPLFSIASLVVSIVPPDMLNVPLLVTFLVTLPLKTLAEPPLSTVTAAASEPVVPPVLSITLKLPPEATLIPSVSVNVLPFRSIVKSLEREISVLYVVAASNLIVAPLAASDFKAFLNDV